MDRNREISLGAAAAEALARGDAGEAARLARELLVLQPKDANANQILGLLALNAGEHARARGFLEAADAAAPNQGPILNALGVALRRCGDLAGARDALKRAGRLGSAEAWRNLGILENAEGDGDAALAAYEAAIGVDANDVRAHVALAQGHERRHDLARARRHADAALRIEPGHGAARIALAQLLLRQGMLGEAEQAALPIANSAAPTERALAWGIVGDARDKQDRPREAFAAFTEANRALLQIHGALLRDTASPYHPDAVRRMTEAAERAEVSAWAPPRAGDADPVFFVGFPRSGTTLLEQVLASHSGLFCLEEKPFLAAVTADIVADPARLNALELMPEDQILARRAAYWTHVEREAGQAIRGHIVIDKLPLHIVLLPLIRRLYPRAKMIVALRDPRDVIVSCFQQRFGMNAAMVQFLTLETAARYYDAVMRLYEVSRDRLGLDLHVVRYERIVEDLEGTARGVCAFLGVPYEPAMLAFRETALVRDIKTPSARQVIQPLYRSSLGRWRRYADDLAPVLPTLESWARRLGYA